MADDLASRSLALVILEGSSLVVLNILSLAGNIMVCLSVYRNPRLRTPTNLYIIALAVSDLLSAVFVMPLSEIILFTGKWSLGETICQFHAFMSIFVVYVSPATMGLTAVNRYVRICKPNTTYQIIFSLRKSRLWVLFLWLFVACYIAIPKLAKLQDFEFVPGYAQCSLKHLGESAKFIHYIIVLTLFLVIPLVATTFGYSRVLKVVRQHLTGISPALRGFGRNDARISIQEIRLSRSLFIVVFAFLACWIPLWVSHNKTFFISITLAKKFGTVVHVFSLHFKHCQSRHICRNEFYIQERVSPYLILWVDDFVLMHTGTNWTRRTWTWPSDVRVTMFVPDNCFGN